MTPNDYQQAALRTAPGYLPPERLLLNGLMERLAKQLIF